MQQILQQISSITTITSTTQPPAIPIQPTSAPVQTSGGRPGGCMRRHQSSEEVGGNRGLRGGFGFGIGIRGPLGGGFQAGFGGGISNRMPGAGIGAGIRLQGPLGGSIQAGFGAGLGRAHASVSGRTQGAIGSGFRVQGPLGGVVQAGFGAGFRAGGHRHG